MNSDSVILVKYVAVDEIVGPVDGQPLLACGIKGMIIVKRCASDCIVVGVIAWVKLDAISIRIVVVAPAVKQVIRTRDICSVILVNAIVTCSSIVRIYIDELEKPARR